MAQTLTSKSQVTVPKAVRQHLGIGPGSAVSFDVIQSGDVVIRPAHHERPRSRFEKARGILKTDMTTDQIMAMLRGDD